MAVQYQVAFSSQLIGAGILAGGPYYCMHFEGWCRVMRDGVVMVVEFFLTGGVDGGRCGGDDGVMVSIFW